MGTTYKQAGVDVDAGDALVDRIKPLAAATQGPEVLSGIGGFGGLFALPPGPWTEPVLVAGCDGVGTKLKVAFEAGRHDTIGIDLVAMSVNDVLTTGARPLFFLDYYATSRLETDVAEAVIRGIARGCEASGCALLGGETAELPGFYAPKEYDLAGFCVGIAERAELLDGKRCAPGDALLALPSSGLHSNGYSLARRVLLEDAGLPLNEQPAGHTRRLDDELLEPTRIYAREVKALRDAVDLKALAHITGGGIPGNLPRVLPDGVRAVVDRGAWEIPSIFELIGRLGSVEEAELFKTFNMGIGMIAVMQSADIPAALRALSALGLPGGEAFELGCLEACGGPAEIVIQ